MLSIDFKSWNSLRNFIEGKENVHIDITTHIDFLVSIAKKILRAEFEAGNVVITKDNIHLYYEFMSDDDKYKNIKIILSLLVNRILAVDEYFNFNPENENQLPYDEIFNPTPDFSKMDLKNKHYKFKEYKNTPLDIYYFGVKDTLKPIDEYIAEIKASKDYQEYMLKNTKITLDITNIKSGATYDFCTYIIYDAGIEVKRFEDVAYTQKAFINFHKKIFNEFGCYKVNKDLLSSMSDYDYTKEFLL